MAQNLQTWRVREVMKFHHDDQSTTLEALEIWSDSDLVCIDVDTEEHARLIAAAPDLVAALARLANELEMPGERGVLHGLPGALAEARKALARAEGHTQ